MAEQTGILHLGAPKCGSSALQTALSLQPALVDGAGRRHVYLAPPETDPEAPVLTGRKLTVAAGRGSRGYVNWPAAPGVETRSAQGYWRHLDATLGKARASDTVPIMSNEGWIAQAAAFSQALPGRLEGMVAAAFVRPPVDWLNAAYWQWGVWSGISIDQWIAGAGKRYRPGRWLADWAALPGLRLVVRPSGGDVVASFAEAFDLDLVARSRANTAAPPALIGLMLRHRRFRPDPHMPAVEFIFGRWCRVAQTGADRLWAIRPHHLEQIAAATRADVDLLLTSVLSAEAEALSADPAWCNPLTETARTALRMRRLDHPEGLAALHRALCDGLVACSAVTGLRPPSLPPAPAASAGVADWDAALCPALDALIAADAMARSPMRKMRSRIFGAAPARTLPDLFGPQALIAAQGPARPEIPHHALPAEHRPHEARIAPLFGGQPGRAGKRRLAVPLLILAETDQSGGELLAEGLRATGLVRDGRMLLHHETVAAILAKHPATDLPDYLCQAVARACHGTGETFALRASWDQLAMALRCGLTGMFAAVRIVHLVREDALAQAVAASLARQRRAGIDPPELNPDEIAQRINGQARADALIPMLADSAGIARMRLSHEALTTRPRAGLRRVLDFCGLAPDLVVKWAVPKPVSASDPQAATLIAHYHAIMRDAVAPDDLQHGPL